MRSPSRGNKRLSMKFISSAWLGIVKVNNGVIVRAFPAGVGHEVSGGDTGVTGADIDAASVGGGAGSRLLIVVAVVVVVFVVIGVVVVVVVIRCGGDEAE